MKKTISKQLTGGDGMAVATDGHRAERVTQRLHRARTDSLRQSVATFSGLARQLAADAKHVSRVKPVKKRRAAVNTPTTFTAPAI